MTRRRDTSAASAARFQELLARRPVTQPDPPTEPESTPLPTPPPRRQPQPPKHERMSITREQIEELRLRAERRGDRLFVQVCERALRWDRDAMNACKAAIWGLA